MLFAERVCAIADEAESSSSSKGQRYSPSREIDTHHQRAIDRHSEIAVPTQENAKYCQRQYGIYKREDMYSLVSEEVVVLSVVVDDGRESF
jgi:hypothetical protein